MDKEKGKDRNVNVDDSDNGRKEIDKKGRIRGMGMEY